MKTKIVVSVLSPVISVMQLVSWTLQKKTSQQGLLC